MQVLITYLPYQTLSPLMTRNSHEDISRAGFENNCDMEAIFWGDYLCLATGQDYHDFPFQRFFFSWPNIKVFHEDFQVVFLRGEKTWTYLWMRLFPSAVSSKCFFTGVDLNGVQVALPTSPCSNLFTNEYSDPTIRILWADRLQTWLKYFSPFIIYSPTFGQICTKSFPLQPFDWFKDFGPNWTYLA